MDAFSFRTALFFTLRFVAVFAILISLPSHWGSAIGSLFRAEFRALESLVAPPRTTSVIEARYPGYPEADMEIDLSPPPSRTGAPGRIRVILLNSRTLAGVPHAMAAALCLSTCWPRPLRVWMPLAGLTLANLWSLAAIFINVQFARMAPEMPGWQRTVWATLNDALVANLWSSFAGPLVMWAGLAAWKGWQQQPDSPSAGNTGPKTGSLLGRWHPRHRQI